MRVRDSDMGVTETVTWVSACCLARVLVPLVRWRVVRRTHLHVQLELSHDLLGNRLLAAPIGAAETSWRYDDARGRIGFAPTRGAGAACAGSHAARQVQFAGKVVAMHFDVAAVRHRRCQGHRWHREELESARPLCFSESSFGKVRKVRDFVHSGPKLYNRLGDALLLLPALLQLVSLQVRHGEVAEALCIEVPNLIGRGEQPIHADVNHAEALHQLQHRLQRGQPCG